MATGKLPFSTSCTELDIYPYKVYYYDPEVIKQEIDLGYHKAIPAGKFSVEFKLLLGQLLKFDPQFRYDFNQILNDTQIKYNITDYLYSREFQAEFMRTRLHQIIKDKKMKRYRVQLTLKQVDKQYQSYVESFNVKPYADLPTTRAKEAKRQMDLLKRS